MNELLFLHTYKISTKESLMGYNFLTKILELILFINYNTYDRGLLKTFANLKTCFLSFKVIY